MTSTLPDELPKVEPNVSPCRHLRSAGMYLYPDRSHDEMAADDDSTAYWCFHTMKTFGPNDDMVGGPECRDPSRACYQAI
jgi:hypothetical protein